MMHKEICNAAHAKQLTHIDLNTSTLVCTNDVPAYIAGGAHLAPIMEYGYDNAEMLKKIHQTTHELLGRLENTTSYHSSSNPVFEKIEKAFNMYISYVQSVKEKLILKLKKPNIESTQNMANEFCAFAEEASINNINLKKALLNNDPFEIRKFCLNQTTKKLQEKYNFYYQNLFPVNTPPQEITGYDVLFKNPLNDADTVLTHVGIALVGFKPANFNQVLTLKDQGRDMQPYMTSPTIPFKRSTSPPRSYNPNDVANSPTNRFEASKHATIDTISNVSMKIEMGNTLHHYDKESRSFLLFSPIQKRKYYIKVDQLPNFPYEGCFPSRYVSSFIFFSGGKFDGDHIIKSTFMFDLIQGKFIRKADMTLERAFHNIEELNGNVIALGGKISNQQDTAACEIFNTAANEWGPFPNMTSPRSSALSFVFQSNVYMLGGNSNAEIPVTLECIKLQDPDKVWKLVMFKGLESYSFPNQCANSCSIGNGRILIFGGFSKQFYEKSCIFNILTESIESSCNLAGSYYSVVNLSQALDVNGDVVAIDDSKKVHIFSGMTKDWKILDTVSFDQVDFK